MISIVEAISELLFVRDTVVVPGLGAFVRQEVSAKVDEETNRFAPPSCEVEFDANHLDNQLYCGEKWLQFGRIEASVDTICDGGVQSVKKRREG